MYSVCLCVLSLLFECGHSGYLGRIDSPDDLLQKNNQVETVSYRVELPVTSPRPKVTAIAASGVELIPNQVTSHERLQLTSSYGVGGGFPANKRFRRHPPEFEQILQRFGSGNSDKIGDVVGGKLNFESIQDEFKDFDELLEQLHESRFSSNRPSSPILTDITSSKSPVTQPSAPAILQTRPEHRPITITTDECGVVGIERPVPLVQNGMLYERGQLPWLVAVYRTVQNNLLFICGGTLLTDRHVISAAHCMSRLNVETPIIEILIKIGVHSLNDWSDDTVKRKLMAVSIHEDYNATTLKNDILIFTLNKRVKFTQYIRPACLWSGNTELSRVVGAIGVSRQGDIEKEDEPKMLRVPIVSTKECRASNSIFHKLTYDNTLCAGDRNGAGPCNGDSGSGLYLLDGGKWRLRGIVSLSAPGENGARICNLNEYVVYTDTAQFLSWIRNKLSVKYFD